MPGVVGSLPVIEHVIGQRRRDVPQGVPGFSLNSDDVDVV